jgi:hypothetical protein
VAVAVAIVNEDGTQKNSIRIKKLRIINKDSEKIIIF